MAVQEYQYPNSFLSPGADCVLDSNITASPASFDVVTLPPDIDISGGWFVVAIDTSGVREWILVSGVSGSGPYTFTIEARAFGGSTQADHVAGDPVYLELTRQNLIGLLQGQVHTPNTLLLPEKAEPATPDTDLQELYIDDSTGHLTRKNDAGSVIDIEATIGGSLTSTSAVLTSDQTLSVANTLTDLTGCSVSLAAGTWLILAQAKFVLSTSNYALLTIANSSNTDFSTGVGSGNAIALPFSIHAIVTPAITTTYKLRGQSGGTATIVEKEESNSGQVLTQITAIRIGS